MRGDFSRAVYNDVPAANYYRSALRQNANSAEAYYGLGEIALRAEQWTDAATNFEKSCCGWDMCGMRWHTAASPGLIIRRIASTTPRPKSNGAGHGQRQNFLL